MTNQRVSVMVFRLTQLITGVFRRARHSGSGVLRSFSARRPVRLFHVRQSHALELSYHLALLAQLFAFERALRGGGAVSTAVVVSPVERARTTRRRLDGRRPTAGVNGTSATLRVPVCKMCIIWKTVDNEHKMHSNHNLDCINPKRNFNPHQILIFTSVSCRLLIKQNYSIIEHSAAFILCTV